MKSQCHSVMDWDVSLWSALLPIDDRLSPDSSVLFLVDHQTIDNISIDGGYRHV